MRPQTEAELAEIIKTASGPLHIKGGGTREIGVPLAGQVLETGNLSGVSLYEPGALTLVVGAGTFLTDIEAVLDAEGQRLPFEPQDYSGLLGRTGKSTIGGIAAANASGPRRIQAGACRDYMLGVRFVDGRGTVLSNGGRVMKNVTGYDLVKLMAGSRGTLGVLTEVSFKVLPKPETSACILINGLTDVEAVVAMSKALGSPYEITGAAHLPVGLDGVPVTMLRIEGFEASVGYRAGEIRAMFSDREVSVETRPEQMASGWRYIRDAGLMHTAEGDVWRLSVKPGDAPELVRKAGARQVIYDWGGGLIWLLMPAGTDLRRKISGFQGHATLVRADESTRRSVPVFQPEVAPLAAISDGLRNQFDPRGLLNPGLMDE